MRIRDSSSSSDSRGTPPGEDLARHPLLESIDMADPAVIAAAELLRRDADLVPSPTLAPGRTLTKSELDALRRVGMDTRSQTRQRAERARQESLFAFIHVFRTALLTEDVAAMLGVNASRIRRRIKGRTLLALSGGRRIRLPAIQFHDTRELPGLSIVLSALPEGTSTLEAVSWLSIPHVDLPSVDASDEPWRFISPRDYLLRTGDGTKVAELARSLRAD